MAGLNFQTCTVVNNFDKDVNYKVDGDVHKLQGIGDFSFDKNNVVSVSMKEAADFTAAVATVDLKDVVADSFYRIEVLVDTEGAQPVVYTAIQNPVPFWTEFTVTSANLANVAVSVADLLNKAFVMGNKLFTASGSSKVLTITANGEYLRIKDIKVYKLDYVDAPQLVANGTVTTKGANGFGTYSHLIKDLRLPSVARAGIAAPYADEMPVVGAKYNQYIINYCAPAPHTGMQAVGQKLENTTTHVFWVNIVVKSAFESFFNAIKAAETSLDD